MKRYLFVCQHNFTRSKYGAEFFRGYLIGKKVNAKVKSAGIGFSSYFFGKRISKRILRIIDWVFVMEKDMKNYLIEKFNFDKKKIVILNIEDKYGFLRIKNIEELDKKFRKVNWGDYL